MSLSFVAWAFYRFHDTSFALCGKTVTSLRRNVVTILLPVLLDLGFTCKESVSKNYVEIALNGRANHFYLFGGRDESSAALIQGMTLGGVLLDEAALMPRSFVEQALARCSVDGSKFWFNCNPENPQHWFYTVWIQKAAEKNCLYLHYSMEDNPSLSSAMVSRYKTLYSGPFYERFVEGKWVAAQGLIYPVFDESAHVMLPDADADFSQYYISCDYGTVNPSSFGLWAKNGEIWHRIEEYYHDSRTAGIQYTDEEYYAHLETLAGGREIEAVIVDPSAASFMQCIRRHGRFRVVPADNDVLGGIRRVSDMLKSGRIRISPLCRDCIREFSLYRWDNASVKDAPRKEHDHAMDDLRYFVATVLCKNQTDFFAVATPRGTDNPCQML
jgi:PBSX family phage terminase large subunit